MVPTTTSSVRTRFAPSPTGFMHVGNLRTALYEYLIARSLGGTFVLRIEDTDRGRLVDGAVDAVYRTLARVGLRHDEGPDVGGDFGPYVQSERLHLYRPHAEALVAAGHAYRCFCTKERLESLRAPAASAGAAEDDGSGAAAGAFSAGYGRHCRDLPAEESARRAAAGRESAGPFRGSRRGAQKTSPHAPAGCLAHAQARPDPICPAAASSRGG